jgi:hypothetical protein
MNTFFVLMAEYGQATIEVSKCAAKFGLSPKTAADKANRHALPVPCFRLEDSQKAPMFVHVSDLAEWIDKRRSAANDEWKRVNSA